MEAAGDDPTAARIAELVDKARASLPPDFASRSLEEQSAVVAESERCIHAAAETEDGGQTAIVEQLAKMIRRAIAVNAKYDPDAVTDRDYAKWSQRKVVKHLSAALQVVDGMPKD